MVLDVAPHRDRESRALCEIGELTRLGLAVVGPGRNGGRDGGRVAADADAAIV